MAQNTERKNPKSKPKQRISPFNNKKLTIDEEIKAINSGKLAKPRKSPFTNKAQNARIDKINAKLKKKK